MMQTEAAIIRLESRYPPLKPPKQDRRHKNWKELQQRNPKDCVGLYILPIESKPDHLTRREPHFPKR